MAIAYFLTYSRGLMWFDSLQGGRGDWGEGKEGGYGKRVREERSNYRFFLPGIESNGVDGSGVKNNKKRRIEVRK